MSTTPREQPERSPCIKGPSLNFLSIMNLSKKMAKCSREQPPGDDVRGPDPLLPPLPDVRAADDAGAAQPALRQGRQDHGEIPVKDRYMRTWAVAL